MTGPFEKGISCFLLFFILALTPMAVQAQQGDDPLRVALQEARNAGLSEATLNRLLAHGYEKQVDPSAMGNLLAILTQCQRERLPLQPFLSKIEEGLTKRVSASRIEQVLKNKLSDYRFTVMLIDQFLKRHGQGGGEVPEEYLIRLTETLSCGVSREELAQLLGKAPAAALAVVTKGVEVLASLKQIHFDPKLSEQIVDTGVKERYFTVAQRDFIRIITVARTRGLHDDEITTVALDIIKRGGSQADLLAQLGIRIQDLDHLGPQLGKGSPGPGSTREKADTGAPVGGQSETPSGSGGSGSDSNNHSEKTASSASVDTEQPQEEENIRFAAAGLVTYLNPAAQIIKLNVEKANRVLKGRIGKATAFTVSDNVKVKSEGSEPGVFDLDLTDIKTGESWVRVLGKKRADGRCQITQVVVCPNEESPKKKSTSFAAFGTATDVDVAASTVTVRIENADDVLNEHIGDEVTFAVGENVTITEESPKSSIAGLSLDDITAGESYLKVIGKKLVGGGVSAVEITVVLDE